jgi:hypothetical protein
MPGLVGLVLDILLMPMMFFISGYFAPPSLGKRGDWAFLKARFTRLILPWAVGVFTLVPLYKMIFLYSRGLPQDHWCTYFCWSNSLHGQEWVLGHIWLWFLPVLFVFHIVYLLLSKTGIRWSISLRASIAIAFFVGVGYSLSLDLLNLRGWTKAVLIDFQNERILIYFMTFMLGVLCFKSGFFEERPKSAVRYHALNAVVWIPLTSYIVFLLVPFFKPGAFLVSPVADRLIVWFSYHLSLLSLMYVTIETFRRYFDGTGSLWSELSNNSYYVYIIHTIVLGVIALGLLHVELPAFAKYVILSVATFGASNLVISLWRRLARAVANRERKRTLEFLHSSF